MLHLRLIVARLLTLILVSGAIWHASAQEPTTIRQSLQGSKPPHGAEKQIRLAHARQLAAQAVQARGSDLDLSLLLGLEALGLLSPEEHLAVPSATEALREALATAGSGLPVGEAMEPRVLTGHQDSIRALAYLPDRGLLASAGDDRVIRLWPLDDPGAEVRVLAGHEDAIRSLVYLPDRGQLASGSDDATVRLWSLDSPDGEPRVLRGHDASTPAHKFVNISSHQGLSRVGPLEGFSQRLVEIVDELEQRLAEFLGRGETGTAH